MSAPSRFGRICSVAVALVLASFSPAGAQTGTFKVAFLNIKSGEGEAPLPGHTATFTENTNCTDPTQPLNAWGVGLVQSTLVSKIKSDPAVIALGLDEAWETVCASPANVQQVLGWAARTGENNGVALVAKYGFAGAVTWKQLDTSLNANPKDTMWVLRAPVCADAACSQVVIIFSTHWYGTSAEYDIQAQQTVDFTSATAVPNVLIGDFNVWEGTGVVCNQSPQNTALPKLRQAGYIDAWPAIHGTAEGYTGMVNRAGCGTPEGYAWKRIDYAWSRGVAPVSIERFGMMAPGDPSPSDHYGIIAEYPLGGDTIPPVVGVTSPTAGQTVAGTTPVTITASDNVAVASVSLLMDGATAATLTTAPYSYSWNTTTVSDGAHTLEAIAVDTSGNAARTGPIAVAVNNSATLSGVPMAYIAFTDLAVRVKPPLPQIGPAGSSILDPTFGSKIIRVTDAATRPNYTSRSFRSASNSHQNVWNTTSKLFYVVGTDGAVIPFTFDPLTTTASRIQPSASGDGGLILQFFGEPEFSFVKENAIYGVYQGSNLRTITQYDFSTQTYAPILDLDTVVSGLSGTYVGGVAASAGSTERILTFFGGTSQDYHYLALVFDVANPSSRKIVDTVHSTINGVATNVTLNFHLHHAWLDKSGRYVSLYPTGVDRSSPRNADPVYIWDTQTDVITGLPSIAAHSNGHDAYGFGTLVNQDCCTTSSDWDAAEWQFRYLSSPLITRDLILPVLTPQEVYWEDHPSWNNAQSNALVPYISGTYRYGTNTSSWRAWDDEIVAVQTDVAAGAGATVWRLAHHRSDISYDGDPTGYGFWYSPRPIVSQDGRWVLYTSNWEKTLGTDPDGDPGTGYRQDAFVLAPTPGGTAPPAPPPPPPLQITTTSVPNGTVGMPYTTTLVATGGSSAPAWSIVSGALPGGLALNAQSGTIAGAPTTAGTFSFTVDATDASCSQTAQASYTMTIASALQVTTTSVANGTVGVAYSATLAATGGSAAPTWSIASGALPGGLALNAQSGTITGTPTTAGAFPFTVRATDTGSSQTAQASYTMTIADPPVTISIPEIVIYAADVQTVVGNWTLASDTTAAAGKRLRNPNLGAAKITTPAASPKDYIEFTFNAEKGRPYRLWIRGRADYNDFANDSVYVQFSGSVTSTGTPVDRIGTTSAETMNLEDCSGCGLSGWGWQDDGYGVGVLGPLIYFATTGPQKMRIQVREDGLSIDQIVLSSVKYLTISPGALKNDTTIVPKPTPVVDLSEIVVYAASANTVKGNWRVVSDPSAAGGSLINQPDTGAAKIATALASPTNYFELTFNAEAGRSYRLWMRGRAQNDDYLNDSVHVQFSGTVDQAGAPAWRIGTTNAMVVILEDCSGCGLSGWGWQDNGWGVGVLGPIVTFATTGPQTIRVQQREDGFAIDEIVLSSVRYITQSPGALKNDTTILPKTQ